MSKTRILLAGCAAVALIGAGAAPALADHHVSDITPADHHVTGIDNTETDGTAGGAQ